MINNLTYSDIQGVIYYNSFTVRNQHFRPYTVFFSDIGIKNEINIEF